MNRNFCATLLIFLASAAMATRLDARGFGGHHAGYVDDIFDGGLTDGLLYRLGGIDNLTVGQFYDSDLAGGGRGETTPGAIHAGSGDIGRPRFRGLNVGGQNDGRFRAPQVTGFQPTGFQGGLRPDASAGPARVPVPTTGKGARQSDYRALPSDGGLHFLSGSVDTGF